MVIKLTQVAFHMLCNSNFIPVDQTLFYIKHTLTRMHTVTDSSMRLHITQDALTCET